MGLKEPDTAEHPSGFSGNGDKRSVSGEWLTLGFLGPGGFEIKTG